VRPTACIKEIIHLGVYILEEIFKISSYIGISANKREKWWEYWEGWCVWWKAGVQQQSGALRDTTGRGMAWTETVVTFDRESVGGEGEHEYEYGGELLI